MSQVNRMSNLQTADPSTAIARIVGPIDLDHARQTRRKLLACLASRENLLVDMSAVTGIDSAGVASLVEAHNTARKNGKGFALFHVGEPVMRVLRLSRLDRAFTIFSGAPGVHIN